MTRRKGRDEARERFTVEYLWRAWAMPYMARLAIRYAQARNPGSDEKTEAPALLDYAEQYLRANPDDRMRMYAELAEMGVVGTQTTAALEPSRERPSDPSAGNGPRDGKPGIPVYSGTLTQVTRPEDQDFWLDGTLYQDLSARDLRLRAMPLGYWLRNCWLHGMRAESADLLEVPPSASNDEELLSAIRHESDPDGVDMEKLLFRLGSVMERACEYLQPRVVQARQGRLAQRKAYLRQCLDTPSSTIEETVESMPHSGPRRQANADHVEMLSAALQEDACLGSVVDELERLIEEGAEADLASSLRHMRRRCGQDLRLTAGDDGRGGYVVSVTDVARRPSLIGTGRTPYDADAPRVVGVELSPWELSVRLARPLAAHAGNSPLAGYVEPMTEADRTEAAGKEAVEDARRSLGELDPDLIDGIVEALAETTGGGIYPLTEVSAQIPVNALAAVADEPYVVACAAEELRRGVRGISAADALRFVVTGELPGALGHLAPGTWPPISKTNAVPREFIELAMDFSRWLWAEFLHDLSDDGAPAAADPLWGQAFAEALSNLLIKAVFGTGLESGVVTTLKERERKQKARPAGAGAAGGMDSSLAAALKRIRNGGYMEIAVDGQSRGQPREGSM